MRVKSTNRESLERARKPFCPYRPLPVKGLLGTREGHSHVEDRGKRSVF